MGVNPANIASNGKDDNSLTKLSAFQILLQNILAVDGQFDKMPKKFRGPLRCSIKETNPNFIVTDGSYFISAYFTPESYKQFRKSNSSIRVTDLQDIMVQINKWTLELTSSNNFTSFNGLEMKMIITQMDLKKDFRVEMKKYPTNLYRDDKMKTVIKDFMGKQVQNYLKKQIVPSASIDGFVTAAVTGTSSVAAKLESVVSIGAKFDQYSYLKNKATKVLAMIEIIKEEQGKSGIQAYTDKLTVLEKASMFEKKNAGTPKKESTEKMTIKKTLKVGKKSEISTTIKKEDTKKKSQIAKKKSVGSKRPAAKKSSVAKTSPSKAKQESPAKKRVEKAANKKK